MTTSSLDLATAGQLVIPGTYECDCLHMIDAMPDECIDLVPTDPPYGINYKSRWKKSERYVEKRQNDFKPIKNDKAPFLAWIKPLYRVMKPGGRVLCFYRWDVQQAFMDEFRAAGFAVKSQIVWDKVGHGMGDLKGEFAPAHELILYAVKGKYAFPGKRPKSVYRMTKVNSQNLVHPNEKPVKLMTKLIMDVSRPGDVVFDPFGGSFNTYEAAVSINRPCISTELDGDVFARNTARFRREGIQTLIY